MIPILTPKHKSRVFVGVVDDESDIGFLFRDALDNIPGVRAFAFTDPNLALEHFRYNHRYYKCMICDYRMPQMTGIELLNKVKEINPEVARLLISAFEIQDEIFDNSHCVDLFLQKPVRIADLIEKVRSFLTPIKVEEPNSS
jgi:two-component system probable response regulator PhcQ